MKAWTLDTIAIIVGVCLAEIVIQLYITPAVLARRGKRGASDGDALPW